MNSVQKEDVCRLCANPGFDYHSIFSTEANSIVDKIHNCLPIKITPNDKLPTHICNPCLEALNISNKLRSQCLLADSVLRKQLKVVLTDDVNPEKDVVHIKCEPDLLAVTNFDDFNEQMHDSEWVCEFCNDDFACSEDLHRHKSEKHHNENVSTEHTVINDDSNDSDSNEDTPEANGDDHSNKTPISDEEKRRTQCDICNVSITDTKFMELHIKFHQPRPIRCNCCYNMFPSPYDLYIHKKTVHKLWPDLHMKWFCERCEKITGSINTISKHLTACTKRKFACQYCDKEFIYKRDLMPHQKRDHYEILMEDPNVKKFKCESCDKLFVEKSTYTQHLQRHRARMDEKFKCPDCGKAFISNSNLKSHIERLHTSQNTMNCDICHKIFHNEYNMILHKRRTHKKLWCTTCDKQFDDSRSLDEHLVTDHNKHAPKRDKYSCKLCGKSFRKLRLLQDHENIHTGEKPYTCQLCDKTFRTYTAQWAHQKTHKIPDFACDYCNKQFNIKSNLRRHIHNHQDPQDWHYYCEICGIKFSNNGRLQRHLERNIPAHLLTCDICGEQILGMHKLRKHRSQKHDIWETSNAEQFRKG